MRQPCGSDNPDLAEVVQHERKRSGCTVDLAIDPAGGFASLESRSHDLMGHDLGLPEGEGLEHMCWQQRRPDPVLIRDARAAVLGQVADAQLKPRSMPRSRGSYAKSAFPAAGPRSATRLRAWSGSTQL